MTSNPGHLVQTIRKFHLPPVVQSSAIVMEMLLCLQATWDGTQYIKAVKYGTRMFTCVDTTGSCRREPSMFLAV